MDTTPATKTVVLSSVRAQRGPVLRCKGWKQETILRMLENNMENAEHPERLIIYGGIGKAARNWESYHAIVAALKDPEPQSAEDYERELRERVFHPPQV